MDLLQRCTVMCYSLPILLSVGLESISLTQGATQICGFIGPYPQGHMNLWYRGIMSPYTQLKGPHKFVVSRVCIPNSRDHTNSVGFESISPTQGATQFCEFMSPHPQLKGPQIFCGFCGPLKFVHCLGGGGAKAVTGGEWSKKFAGSTNAPQQQTAAHAMSASPLSTHHMMPTLNC